MLHAPSSRRERALIFGRSNAGKSSALLAIAQWRLDTAATFNIYLGDTDHAWDAMRRDEYDPFVSVADLDINDYRPWLEWVKKVRENIGRDDWVCVDMIDKAWEAAQSHYWQQMSPDDVLADIYLRNQVEVNKGAGKGNSDNMMAGSHGANWGIINKFYNAFYQSVINLPCHVLCIAPAAEVRDDEKPEVKNQFKVGWKPKGQKDLPHGFHTVIFAAETPSKWIYTTVRERGPIGSGRQMLLGEPVEDFVMSYLIPIAGWRP